MRIRTLSLLVVAALLPHAQGDSQETGVELTFSEPVLFWNNPTVIGQSPLTVAASAPHMAIRITVEAGTTFSETRNNTLITGDVNASFVPVYTGEDTRIYEEYEAHTIREGGVIELRTVPGRETGLLLHAKAQTSTQADRIRPLAWSGSGDEQVFNTASPHGSHFSDAYRQENPTSLSRDGVLLYSVGPQPLSLDSDQVTHISWTNMVVACHNVDPCPTSDDAEPYRIEDRVAIQPYVTIRLDAPTHVELHTDSALVSMLADEWSIAGPMAARLPKADGTDCQSIGCDGEKTLRLDGDFDVAALRKTDDGRFTASIQGDIRNLILDEQPVDPALLWGVSAAAAGTAALVAVLVSKFGLLGLFTRISPSKALEHRRRRVLFGYIAENPGTTFREVVRKTGIPAGTTRHHLNVLRRCDLVVEKPHKSTLRFFENHGRFDASWDTVILLREEPLLQVHRWIQENPESPQKSIIAAMELEGFPRGTTQHRLTRLVDAGLVTYRQQGRLKLYTAHDRPQTPTHGPMQGGWNGLDASWPEPIQS